MEDAKSELTLENTRNENLRLKQTVSNQMQVIDELKKEHKTKRRIFYQEKFKSYELKLKDMEEEWKKLKERIVSLKMRVVTDITPGEGIQESTQENLFFDQDRQHTVEKVPLKHIAKSSVSSDSGVCMNLDTVK